MINHPLHPEPKETEIQHAAYFLWEAAGRPVGRDLELWLTAKESLRHRLPAVAVARRRATPATTNARNAQRTPGAFR